MPDAGRGVTARTSFFPAQGKMGGCHDLVIVRIGNRNSRPVSIGKDGTVMVETVIAAIIIVTILQLMVWGDYFSKHGRGH